MNDFLLLREFLVLVASAAGAYTDWKTGFIYDRVTLPLVAIGALLNIADGNYYGLLLGAIVFGAGYFLYYTGKLGGGDVKLYTGISLALPELNNGIFILSVVLYSSLSAIVFISSYYTLRYARRGMKLEGAKEGIIKASMVVLMFMAYLYFLSRIRPVSGPLVFIFGVLAVFGGVFLALEKGIRKEFFLKKIRLADAEEDEVLAPEFMNEDERKRLGFTLKGVLGEKEKARLTEQGVKEILVYQNLPRLGPFIFIGTLIAMALPSFTAIVAG